MTDLTFREYWIVLLNRNPDYDRSDKTKTQSLMEQHFQFIDLQIEQGNLFVAIPMDSGGLYIFDGELDRDYMEDLLDQEGSLTGGVFRSVLKRGFVPEHHVFFTLEAKKGIEQFHQHRRSQQTQ